MKPQNAGENSCHVSSMWYCLLL